MNFINMTIFHFYRNTAWCDNIYFIAWLASTSTIDLPFWRKCSKPELLSKPHVRGKWVKSCCATTAVIGKASSPNVQWPAWSNSGKQTGWLASNWKLIPQGLQLWLLPCPEVNVPSPIPIKEHQTEHEAALGFRPHQSNVFSADAELSRKKKIALYQEVREKEDKAEGRLVLSITESQTWILHSLSYMQLVP